MKRLRGLAGFFFCSRLCTGLAYGAAWARNQRGPAEYKLYFAGDAQSGMRSRGRAVQDLQSGGTQSENRSRGRTVGDSQSGMRGRGAQPEQNSLKKKGCRQVGLREESGLGVPDYASRDFMNNPGNPSDVLSVKAGLHAAGSFCRAGC